MKKGNSVKTLSTTTREMVDTAILLALGIGLKLLSDLIPFLNLPDGGTIDLAMLPILLIGLRNGPKYGFAGSTLFWLLCWAIGGFKIYSGFPLIEIVFDRLVPYTMGYGIAGLFWKKRGSRLTISLVIVLSFVIRLASHTISGIFLWYSWTGFSELMVNFWASFVYNVAYVGPTALICLVLFNALFRLVPYKAPLALKADEAEKAEQ